MKSEYTKGKWEVMVFNCLNPVYRIEILKLRAEDTIGIADNIYNVKDARLIAQAPKLYEACKTFQYALAIWRVDPSKAPNTLTTIFEETIGQAITSVEGK